MNMGNMFNGMFGKVQNGMCRLSMNGKIAVKVGNDYKTYNMKQKRLTNCDNFVLDIADDFFFVIPTNKVEKGDIIIANGKPKCVISTESEDGTIKVVNYENGTLEEMLPERHMFLGNTYFYGKVVSLFNAGDGKMNPSKIMSYMMMSQLMGGGNSNGNGFAGQMGQMLPMMMLMNGGKMENPFEGMMDFGNMFNVTEDEDTTVTTEEDE